MELNWNHAMGTLNNSKIEPIQTKKKRQKMLTQTIEQNNLKSQKSGTKNEFGFKS